LRSNKGTAVVSSRVREGGAVTGRVVERAIGPRAPEDADPGACEDADGVRGDRDGKVNVLELGEFAKTRVPELARQIGDGRRQMPRWFFNGDDIFDIRSAD
jgi:hypothetical protein